MRISSVCYGPQANTVKTFKAKFIKFMNKCHITAVFAVLFHHFVPTHPMIKLHSTLFSLHSSPACRYLKCRSAMLCCLSQLVSSCNSLRTSPPPAIAATQAKQAHDELQRCGRITYVIRQSVKSFQEVKFLFFT